MISIIWVWECILLDTFLFLVIGKVENSFFISIEKFIYRLYRTNAYRLSKYHFRR